MSPEVPIKGKEMGLFQENKLHWHKNSLIESLLQYSVLRERVVFSILSKKSVCFLLWEPLFSCRALLFSQVLTHVPLWQPGWKWWYCPGSTWISIQRPFSLNYSYRTHKPEPSWLSLLHLQLFVQGNGDISQGWSFFRSARGEILLLSGPSRCLRRAR